MIELTDVTKVFLQGGKEVKALQNINLTIAPQEVFGIVGQSGSGKSTLINLLLRDFTADSGDIIVDGENINAYSHAQIPYYRRKIGVVFQDYKLFPNMDVYDNLDFAAYVSEVPKKQIKDKIESVLLDVGINNNRIVFSLPKRLSGGEQQRVAIARAILNRPKLILADEPTGNLDEVNEKIVIEILKQLHKEGATIVVVTHDLDVGNVAERKIILEYGKIVDVVDQKQYGKKK